MPEVVDSQQDVRVQAARAAADAVRRDGAELCVRLVFRISRNELRHARSRRCALQDGVAPGSGSLIAAGYHLTAGTKAKSGGAPT